jgi:anti-anti-sigma factor
MAEICKIEDKGNYYQISSFDSENEDFNSIFLKIDAALKEKMQDVVLSLSSVTVLYSSHLAVFVRINQVLRKNNLRFTLVDISPEIKNLLQITQLDSIFPVFETMEDFKNSSRDSKGHSQKTNFEWQIVKDSDDSANVMCKGDMQACESLDELHKSILDFCNISFDFSKLQSIDKASLSLLDTLSNKHAIQVAGASEDVAKLLSEKQIYGKIKIL